MTAAFLEVASPATLAWLIVDVDALSKGAELSHLNLRRQAHHALIGIVGSEHAERLINAATERMAVELDEDPVVARWKRANPGRQLPE
jgi:hypothetical protein